MPSLELIPWDIKNDLLFTDGGVSLQLHRIDTALSGRVFTVGHCSTPPYSEAVLHCTMRTVGDQPMSSSGLLEGLTLFVENRSLWWILLNGMFWFWCPTSARRLLWSSRSQRLAWWHRYRPYSLSRNLTVELHAVMIRYQHIYRIYWTRRLGIWTVHSSVSWRTSCSGTQIYYRCPVQQLPVTQMQGT